MSILETSPVAAEPSASTGPTSEPGKAISSRNAVKHNLCSRKLSGSDLEELNQIRAKLDEEWGPETETERTILAQMALNQWRMDRALSLELSVFDQPDLDPAAVALALRYRTTAERSFYKALSELQRVQALIARNDQRDKQIEEDEDEETIQREIERLVVATFSKSAQPSGGVVCNSNKVPMPQFVSQTNAGPSENASDASAASPAEMSPREFVSQNHSGKQYGTEPQDRSCLE
jgi:hypothetical protein